jgi:hypothetical protein
VGVPEIMKMDVWQRGDLAHHLQNRLEDLPRQI